MSALWALALIMLCSGAAKLRSREDVGETFRRLKVPAPFNAPFLARAFPFLELLLALALVQPLAALRPVVAVAGVVLFVAFLVLVVRAKGDGVSCGCFGEASAAPITGQTVVRNVLFLVLALFALVEAVLSSVVHGTTVAWVPQTALGGAVWTWSLLVAVLLAACAFLVGRESVPAAQEAQESAAAMPPVPAPAAGQPAPAVDGEVLEDAAADGPERVPFPDALVVQDGVYTGLRTLVSQGAVVALRLSTGCGSCSAVIARLPEFRDSLGPVRLKVLMPVHMDGREHAPQGGAIPEDMVVADPAGAAAAAVGLTRFPMAVLLGTDGLTAGGPVAGSEDVLDFLEEIRDIMATELPAAQADAPALQGAAE